MVKERLGVGALLAVWVLTQASGCGDPKRKMEDAQRRRDAEKRAYEDAREAQRKAAAPKLERAQLEAPWASPGYLQLTPGRPCPEGTWALFPTTPGEGAEREAAEARRPELAAKLKEATLVAVLPLGGAVALGRYDARKKTLAVEVDGVLECFDGLGLLSFSLDQPARPFRPPAGDDPTVSPQAVWRAPPLVLQVPFATAEEAKAFTQGPGSGLEARVVFRTGPVAVDSKLERPRARPGEPPPAGPIDWGAGRLVRGHLVGVRLGVDHEKVEVLSRLRP